MAQEDRLAYTSGSLDARHGRLSGSRKHVRLGGHRLLQGSSQPVLAGQDRFGRRATARLSEQAFAASLQMGFLPGQPTAATASRRLNGERAGGSTRYVASALGAASIKQASSKALALRMPNSPPATSCPDSGTIRSPDPVASSPRVPGRCRGSSNPGVSALAIDTSSSSMLRATHTGRGSASRRPVAPSRAACSRLHCGRCDMPHLQLVPRPKTQDGPSPPAPCAPCASASPTQHGVSRVDRSTLAARRPVTLRRGGAS
ncbi:hypothetical protein BU16DRAFT_555919 [Lophium mytilinum]|uniref:Uncharacterized protein n=1 Tax=Lophium mytilinum TaxID=390894 RepID=A0A6A6RAQ7_9PEZI|nr:hypothetical protein BU16DRAFT_555919 [Lophium mytilinum]